MPPVTTRYEGGRSLAAVSFTVPGRFKATALIDSAGMVEQIESVQPNPVLGDTPSVIVFSDYQDFGGVKFPMPEGAFGLTSVTSRSSTGKPPRLCRIRIGNLTPPKSW